MDFALSEIQQDIATLAGQILRDASTPERLKALEESGQRLDPALWSALQEAGLAAPGLPEAQGGAGLGFFETCLALEQLGRTVAAVPLAGHAVGVLALQRAGAQSALEAVCTPGAWLACSSRTDDGNTLRAAQQTLSGSISALPFAQGAARLLVPARQGQGWQLFVVDPAQPGVTLQAQTSTAFEPQARVQLDGVAALPVGDGELPAWLHERLVVAGCAMQTGVLEEMIDLTKRYVAEREQFGARIGSFQSVSHRMADAWIDLMTLRLLAQSAAAMLDAAPLATLEVLSAQSVCAEAGHRVSASCQHVHGGMGHDRDYPLWRYAIRARHLEMAHGGASQAYAALGAQIARWPSAAAL